MPQPRTMALKGPRGHLGVGCGCEDSQTTTKMVPVYVLDRCGLKSTTNQMKMGLLGLNRTDERREGASYIYIQ